MLIFDSFKKEHQPEAFARSCRRRDKQAWIWPSQDAMHEAFERGEAGSDVFPFELEGVVVTVERDEDYRRDEYFEVLVKRHGGKFAGT